MRAAGNRITYSRAMKANLDVAAVTSFVETSACAAILSALIGGRALTARELARAAGTSLDSTRRHLSLLEKTGAITPRRQGPHHYSQIAGVAVAQQVSSALGSAVKHAPTRIVTGPRDPALRRARVCYGHLAGPRAVRLFDHLTKCALIAQDNDDLRLTDAGKIFFGNFGIGIAALRGQRGPLCKTCLDWSERRSHLAGPLGTALLNRIVALGWARRDPKSRLITFSQTGGTDFDALFCA